MNFHKDFIVHNCELVLYCLKFCINLHESKDKRISTAKDVINDILISVLVIDFDFC